MSKFIIQLNDVKTTNHIYIIGGMMFEIIKMIKSFHFA